MKYRSMGNLGWKVSTLGFGAMKLLTIKKLDGETGGEKPFLLNFRIHLFLKIRKTQ